MSEIYFSEYFSKLLQNNTLNRSKKNESFKKKYAKMDFSKMFKEVQIRLCKLNCAAVTFNVYTSINA